MTTVRNATVDDNFVTGSTVANPTVRNPDNATVFDNTARESILKELSSASHPDSTATMEDDMEVLRSVVMLQKVAS